MLLVSVWSISVSVFGFYVLALVFSFRTSITSLGFVAHHMKVQVLRLLVLQTFVLAVLALRFALWSWPRQWRFRTLTSFLRFVAEKFEVYAVRLFLLVSRAIVLVHDRVVHAETVFELFATVDRIGSRQVVASAFTPLCTDIRSCAFIVTELHQHSFICESSLVSHYYTYMVAITRHVRHAHENTGGDIAQY